MCACGASLRCCCCQWLLLCSAESPSTSTLALLPPEGGDCLQEATRQQRQIALQGHSLPARLFQHASPGAPAARRLQLAGAAQLQAGAANGAPAGWAGPHAAAGCIPAWVSSVLAGLVEAGPPAARLLLAEHLQAQQQQHAQAGSRPRFRGWTLQPQLAAAAGAQYAAATAAQMLASPPQSSARNRKGRKGKALTKPFLTSAPTAASGSCMMRSPLTMLSLAGEGCSRWSSSRGVPGGGLARAVGRGGLSRWTPSLR